jgi:DNA-binding NtrC family response regulator
VPALFTVRGETIHRILVIAEKQEIGPCIEGVLREDGYDVTIENSYVSADTGRRDFDLIIATNTSLTPVHIQRIIPQMKARHPDARLIVLSGYRAKEWVTDLKKNGTDEVLELPFEKDAFLREVSGLLSQPIS